MVFGNSNLDGSFVVCLHEYIVLVNMSIGLFSDGLNGVFFDLFDSFLQILNYLLG